MYPVPKLKFLNRFNFDFKKPTASENGMGGMSVSSAALTASRLPPCSWLAWKIPSKNALEMSVSTVFIKSLSGGSEGKASDCKSSGVFTAFK